MTITRTLHLGAMPFPSPQGTQAAVRAMVDALADAGREAHLLTYGFGGRVEGAFGFHWHRGPCTRPSASMRSGPSLSKVGLDLRMVRRVRALHARLRPELVVAHHVEACAAAVLASVGPVVFIAHTALGPELPVYLPRAVRAPARAAGRALERWLARRVSATCAITPSLARYLAESVDARAAVLTVPWRLPSPRTLAERSAARRQLRIGDADEVALYAGNLDAYQGWTDIVAALASRRERQPRAHLLVATASDPAPLLGEARRAGVADRLTVAPVEGEVARRLVHAAADVALVPRRTPGGLPIKLLDALARGVPTIAGRRATAGMDVRDAAVVATDDEPDALAHGWAETCANPTTARNLGEAGRRYVATMHAPGRFVRELDEVAGRIGA